MPLEERGPHEGDCTCEGSWFELLKDRIALEKLIAMGEDLAAMDESKLSMNPVLFSNGSESVKERYKSETVYLSEPLFNKYVAHVFTPELTTEIGLLLPDSGELTEDAKEEWLGETFPGRPEDIQAEWYDPENEDEYLSLGRCNLQAEEIKPQLKLLQMHCSGSTDPAVYGKHPVFTTYTSDGSDVLNWVAMVGSINKRTGRFLGFVGIDTNTD